MDSLIEQLKAEQAKGDVLLEQIKAKNAEADVLLKQLAVEIGLAKKNRDASVSRKALKRHAIKACGAQEPSKLKTSLGGGGGTLQGAQFKRLIEPLKAKDDIARTRGFWTQ